MSDDFTSARDLGEILRIRRERLKLTRQELAGLLGVSHSTISAWERGLNLEGAADYFRAMEIMGFRVAIRSAVGDTARNPAAPVLKFPWKMNSRYRQ